MKPQLASIRLTRATWIGESKFVAIGLGASLLVATIIQALERVEARPHSKG